MYTVDIDYDEELSNAVSIAREAMPSDIRRLINSLKYDLYFGPFDEGYEDGDDFYYITYNGREITWNSAVGKLIYLKGKIDDYDYANFIRLAKLNHWDQIDVWKRLDSPSEYVDKHIKIQTSDAGTLEKIFIKEGEHVYKNQLLMVLSDSKVKTEFIVLNQQLAAYLCREAALKSILSTIDVFGLNVFVIAAVALT